MNISRIIRRLPLNIFRNNNLICLNLQVQTQIMRYSRWVHRIPSKIIYPDNEVEEAIKEIKVEKTDKKTKKNSDRTLFKSFSKPVQKNKEDTNTSTTCVSKEEAIFDDEVNQQGGTEFTTLFNTDPTLSQLMTKVKSRKTREKFGLMLLEGKRLNQDAILAGLIPQQMFFSRKDDVEDLSMPSGVVKMYKITYKAMQLWSTVQTPPGLFGFYKIPQPETIKEDPNSLPLTIICDNVRDPGNVGAILRIAAGVGCSKVLFLKGCADAWDCKVLRAGSGGHFRIPFEQDIEWDDINHILDVNTSVLLADNREHIKGDNAMSSYLPLVPYHSVNFSAFSSLAIVIGGETEGLSKQAILLSRYRNGVRLHISLANEVDSLNTGAALSVILFEIKRQLTRHQDNEVYFEQ